MKLQVFFVILLLFFSVNGVYGENMKITVLYEWNEFTFDGKWTEKEWKGTSQTIVREGVNSFVVRYAHDYENIFILIDFVTDTSYNKNADKGMICFDKNNDKANIPLIDDLCFIAKAGSDKLITLQGGSYVSTKGFYKVINNFNDTIGVGGFSDENDRYSKIPHTSYEFKIPIKIIGRSDIYGFYVGVFDANEYKQYSWPVNATESVYPFIPAPNQWGELISPDKSIPEFNPFFVLIPSFIIIIFVLKIRNNIFLNFKFY